MPGLIALLKKQFGSDILDTHAFRGDETVILRVEALKKVMQFLRDDQRTRLNLLVDITAVDWPERRPRFDVVYHLYSIPLKHRLRVKVPVDAGDGVPSMVELWRSANWLEREVWDMFGIRFDGHPDLRRILMWDGFQGHPLRKDYPLQGEQPRVPYRVQPRNPWKDPDQWKDKTS